MAAGTTRHVPDDEITLAHLSDPHLSSLKDVDVGEILGKRALGYLSWHWRRRHVHLPATLACLTEDARHHRPDHLVVTGDLTQLGTRSECTQALGWLECCGDPTRVTVVPGNHDAYGRARWSQTVGMWAAYMAGDGLQPPTTEEGPFVRRRGPLALVGLSTARPTAPFLASGRLGQAQLERLDAVLATTGRAGLCRVVLIHHPPVPALTGRRRGLDDAAAFAAVVARRGAELILHGHTHRGVRSSLPGPAGPIPVLGVPSASAAVPQADRTAAYHLYRVRRGAGGWLIQVQCRAFDAARAAARDGPRWRLEVAAQVPPGGPQAG